MQRFHDEVPLFRTRLKKNARLNGQPRTHLGRFRKMKPLDCGKTQCKICHWEKVQRREATMQEKVCAVKLKEGLD
jgi:hypothetical protein